MAGARIYTINGSDTAASAQGKTQDPAGVLSITATASYPRTSQTVPITYSQTSVFDPNQPANQALSTAEMQVQTYFESIANRPATLVMLDSPFQQIV